MSYILFLVFRQTYKVKTIIRPSVQVHLNLRTIGRYYKGFYCTAFVWFLKIQKGFSTLISKLLKFLVQFECYRTFFQFFAPKFSK